MNKLQTVKMLNIVPPAAIVDNASFTTTEIDTAGYDYATVVCSLGASDIAMTALKMQESDASGSGFADITGHVYGTSTDIDGSTSALPTATDDNGVFTFELDLKGRKRYLDLVATAGDGAAGTYMSALVILSKADEVPTTVSARGLTGALQK